MIELVGKHKNGKGGTIVNIASILGLENIPFPIYCSSKHAVVSFTRAMKECYQVTGVRMVAICPGYTKTALIKDIFALFKCLSLSKAIQDDILQSPDNAANAVAKIIETGKNGDVWVSKNNEPPYAVRDVDHYSTMKIEE